MPLPVFNTKRGEIQQRQAERQRALLDLRQTEVLIRQDVESALARLAKATGGVKTYQNEILPNMKESMAGLERLFAQADPGVDVLRLIDMRRKLLRAHDGYLDSLWEVTQAQARLLSPQESSLGTTFAASL